jgi:hypothetical protein
MTHARLGALQSTAGRWGPAVWLPVTKRRAKGASSGSGLEAQACSTILPMTAAPLRPWPLQPSRADAATRLVHRCKIVELKM